MLNVGGKAPEFTLPVVINGEAGFDKKASLKDYLGKGNVVLAFYPFAFTGTATTGCACELGNFQKDIDRFRQNGAEVLALSCDSMFANKAFAEKLGSVSYPLFCDYHPHGAVTKQYDVWDEARGKALRALFVIDCDGVIRWTKLYETGVPDNEEVLGEVCKLPVGAR
jgi:alkyl hydroperoxide reductase subunit AhpC